MNHFIATWKGEEVGILSDPWNDMWRLEGQWTFKNSPQAVIMQQLLQEKDAMQRLEDPTLTINLVLTNAEDCTFKKYALAMILEEERLVLREVVSAEGLARFFSGHGH
ncbi:hypothetical protein [Taibaiella koreensis]|uniref:hypothetical protein n=1 Tax=Taibaiella koreensis TaxID=1268548 RepID=UPI000E59FE28|nr:hypothetical protein [Taibaiella koreensis]